MNSKMVVATKIARLNINRCAVRLYSSKAADEFRLTEFSQKYLGYRQVNFTLHFIFL